MADGALVTANPFPKWLAEVAADAVVIRPDDIGIEARGNLRSFTLTLEQAAIVTTADVEAFVAKVVDGLRVWLVDRGAASMTLYWWHDEQAGQLRFSLVSANHERLPFECEVVATSVSAIAAEWLGSPYLHGIPWVELQSPVSNEAVLESPPVLPVWSVCVP